MSRSYWRTRTPTKQATIDPPPNKLNRIGEASTAARRQEDRVWERRVVGKRVQLAIGMLVVWDRKPYRVIEIRERPEDLWPARFEEGFAQAVLNWDIGDPKWRGDRPERATWVYRPVNVAVVPATQPMAKPLHLLGPARQRWDVLPEHYAVCVACGELPPCSHELTEDSIDLELAKSAELMRVEPGCCLGCTEPITSRMKAVRFPGPNLWRPDFGDGSAVFHARGECSDYVDRYRKQFQDKGDTEQQLTFPDDQEA
jgi:hypothetical protein